MKKTILYINQLHSEVTPDSDTLADKLAIELSSIHSLKELPAKLISKDVLPDLIVFDIPNLCSSKAVSVFEIVNMVSTLTRCAGEIPPVLAVLVNPDTDLKLLTDILDADIKGIVPAVATFGVEEAEKAVVELLAGRTYAPKHIMDRIKANSSRVVTRPQSTVDAIRLTARQEQVLRLICNRGASNKSIAKLLNISESTVKLHITAVLKKYGVRNRTQLALFASHEYRT